MRSIYDGLIEEYLRRGDKLAALEVAERIRAASFEFGAGARNTEVRTVSDALSQRISAARKKAMVASGARQQSPGPSSEAQLQAALQELDALLAQAELATPTTSSAPRDFKTTVSRLQSRLGPKRCLLMFHQTESGWRALVIGNDSIDVISLEGKRERVSGLIRAFRDFAWDDGSVPPELTQLYAELILPATSAIAGKDLIVVPSGALNYLPFAALHDGTRYLLEDRIVSQALGLGHTLQLLEGAGPAFGGKAVVLVAARPINMKPLLHADDEAAAAGRTLRNGTVIVNAKPADFALYAPTVEVVHFAAHAVLDTASPLLSRIVLQGAKDDDGLLSVADIRRTPLPRRPIVVLSGCETGVGRIASDESVQGLSSAFLQAGAQSVISSLWLVDDSPTASLMTLLYGSTASGVAPAQALRAAMLKVKEAHPHPYYWASFQYTGPL